MNTNQFESEFSITLNGEGVFFKNKTTFYISYENEKFHLTYDSSCNYYIIAFNEFYSKVSLFINEFESNSSIVLKDELSETFIVMTYENKIIHLSIDHSRTMEIPFNEFYSKVSFFINQFKDSHEIANSITEVNISIPQKNIDSFVIDRVINAVENFMMALGYELEKKEDPIFGLFFQKIMFKLKRKIFQAELDKIIEKGKQSLKSKLNGISTDNETSSLSITCSELIKSIDNIESIVIICGSIIIVKTIINGEKKLAIDKISPTFQSILDKKPALIYKPEELYSQL